MLPMYLCNIESIKQATSVGMLNFMYAWYLILTKLVFFLPTQLLSTCRLFPGQVDLATSTLPVPLPAVLTLNCSALLSSLVRQQ